MFYWLFPLLEKLDAATFEVILTIFSQNIIQKQFLRQLTVPPFPQYVYERKIFRIFFKKKHAIKKVEVSRREIKS